MHDNEMKRMQLQLRQASHRNEELSKLAELKARAAIGAFPKDLGGVQYDDDILEFSVTETDVTPQDNILDIWFGFGEFDETALKKILPEKLQRLDKLATVFTVDFYNHDTLTSGMC